MTIERIDIAVTDKVDKRVATNLNNIADAAERGESHLQRLKSALSAVNTSGVDRLASAMARADSAAAKLVSAQARLTNAQNATSVASQKVALAQQKLATESARTEAAQQRASAATSAAAQAALRLQAAQTAAQGSSRAAATASSTNATATTQASSAATTASNSFRQYVNSLNSTKTAAMGVAGAQNGMTTSILSTAKAQVSAQRAARTTTHVNANIIAQLQDIGVSLAGGQNPLLVAIQQGSQLSFIASTLQGGLRQLTGIIARMLLKVAPLAVAIGALYLGFKNFNDEVARNSKPALEAYARTLGLTAEEMKNLQGKTLQANGTVKEHDLLVVTMGDTWNGFLATVGEGLQGFSKQWDAVANFVAPLWDQVLKFLYNAFLGFFASVRTLIELLGKTFVNVFKISANVVIGIFNGVVIGVETVVNGAVDLINSLAEGANGVLESMGFDGAIGKLDRMDSGVKSITQGMFELESIDIGASFRANVREADATLTGFAQRWEANTQKAARDRIKAAADAIIANRSPSGSGSRSSGKTPEEKRADALAEINRGLDNQISRMGLLRDEREVQQRLDRISEQLARKNITLSEAEALAIEGKVRAIQEFQIVQQQMDRIYQEIQGPQQQFNAGLEATNHLLDMGAITATEHSLAVGRLERAYDQATDPLFQLQEGLDATQRTLGLYGIELEQANFLEQVRQNLVAQGYTGDRLANELASERVQNILAQNRALIEQLEIERNAAQFVEPALEQNNFIQNYQAIYNEIDRLRQNDLQNEAAYQQALYGLQARYNEMRLSGVSELFGAIAQATSQGYGAIGAISKAAAVAQATIDGYVAVQKALASLPPPFNFAAAAAVAVKTGAQVAGILSTNVGGFATGGQFVVKGGNDGVDTQNINMDVRRGERVTVETPAQQRDSQRGSAVMQGDIKVINMFDEAEFIAAMDSEEGATVVRNIIRRNPDILQQS